MIDKSILFSIKKLKFKINKVCIIRLMTLQEIIDRLYDHQKDALDWCKKRQKECNATETDVLKIGGGILSLSMARK